MLGQIILTVFRLREGDDSKAKEFHESRNKAMHQVFDSNKSYRVSNWGDTDDINPHECVHLEIDLLKPAISKYAVDPRLQVVGKMLAEKEVDKATIELLMDMISSLMILQKSKEIEAFSIEFADKTKIWVEGQDLNEKISFYAEFPLA